MSEYTVEKTRFSVKLFFASGAPSEGDIFLSSFAAHHEGGEHVIDVLNQTDQFIPVHSKDESTKLINKNNILMVTFPSDGDGTEDPGPAGSSVEVIIHLINDTCLEGVFFFSLPAHSRRVKDFLNQPFMDKPESFLELRKEAEICLVNKAYILFVEEKKTAMGGSK